MARRYGWLPDKPDHRDEVFGVAHLRGRATVALPAEYSLPVVAPKDQQDTGSCTGQAISQAVRIANLAEGRTCPELSALAPYWWGRAEEHDGSERVDNGARIRDVIKAVTRFGVPDETAWPFDESKVDVMPNFTALRSAYDRRGIRGYYSIPIVTPLAIRQAIASGYPIVAGWQLGQAFEEYDGTGALGKEGLGSLGGHAIPIFGYTASGTYLILNSWGEAWGRSGCVEVNEDFLAGATNAWAIDVRD